MMAEDKFDDMMSKIPDNYKNRVLSIASKIIDYKNKTELKIEARLQGMC